MRKDGHHQQGSSALHAQMHEAETSFSGSSLKHGALRSATTGSPVMERWVHENGVHEHISIPGAGYHKKSASSYVTYHHKTQASPTQRGVRPALKMVRGGIGLSTETLLHGHNTEEAGAGSPQSHGSRSRRYQPGHHPAATSPVSMRSANQARSQHTANGGASVSGATSSTTSSPSHLEGSSTQTSPKRRQTTLAEFGRTLMASKRMFNADGASVASTSKSSPRLRSAAADDVERGEEESSAADFAAAAMADTSPANCTDGGTGSRVDNGERLRRVRQETPRSGAALGDAPLVTTRNGVGRKRSGSSQFSAHSLYSDSGSPRSGSSSSSPTTSSARNAHTRNRDGGGGDGGAGGNASTGAAYASSIAQTTGEAFGADMAIKIVQHHKDVTPTAKLGAGLKRIEGTGRTPLVLVAFGALNPVHLNHLRMFQTARAYIEAHTDFGVIGGYLCPAHDKYVRSKCRSKAAQAIPAKHRVRLCQLMVQDSSWIDCNRWEVTRNTGFLDYPTVLEHCHAYMLGTLGPSVRTMYLCGIDELAKLAPDVLQNYGAICVCRYSDERAIKEARKIRRRSGGQVYVAEDKDIIHTSLASANSTRVRKLLIQGGSGKATKGGGGGSGAMELVGPACLRYLKKHHLGRKLAGKAEWTAEDRDIDSLFGNDDEDNGDNALIHFEPSGRGLYETTGGSRIRRVAVDPENKKRTKRMDSSVVLIEHGHSQNYVTKH